MIPQKRHTSLQPLSREHHQALLLCWKFRQGFAKGVEPERMKKYADWFWTTYLAPHFVAEEKTFFPILATDHPGILKALKQHKDIKAMFHSKDSDIAYTLRSLLNWNSISALKNGNCSTISRKRPARCNWKNWRNCIPKKNFKRILKICSGLKRQRKKRN